MCIATVFHCEAKFFNIGPMKTCPTQRFFRELLSYACFWKCKQLFVVLCNKEVCFYCMSNSFDML